MQCKRFML